MTAHEDEDDRHREDPQRRRGRSVLATVEDCDDEIGQYGEHGRDEDPDGEKVLEAAPVETSHDVSPASPKFADSVGPRLPVTMVGSMSTPSISM